MRVDLNKLGELIDGYGGISADDLHALPAVRDARDEELKLLRDENVRLREALAHVEVVLTILRGAVCYTGGDQDELQSGVNA